MPLSAHVTLQGHFVVSLGSSVIHTYVSSSCGASWGCHGTSVGGNVACSNAGSSILADCIEGGDEAAINYGFNGVCHQTANRILAAASIHIPQTHPDITATYLLYGRYGWGNWPSRLNGCSSPGSGGSSTHSPRSGNKPSSGSSGSMKFDPTIDKDRISSISEMLAEGLGRPANLKKVRQFAMLQAEFQQYQMQLAEKAMADEMSREDYLAELDEAMQKLAASGETLFGFDDFHKVFGAFRADELIDKDAFIQNDHGPLMA